jgi:hypothetical protein
MVGTVKYDVSKPPFLDVMIPAASELVNARQIHYNGEIKPISVILVFPIAKTAGRWVDAIIDHFPYDPKYFTKTYTLPEREKIVLRAPLHLRVFPLTHPITNWTALGEMRITPPASPHFDYGLPTTNQITSEK